MKLLYLTDTHIRASSPQNRTDDFVTTLKNKMREVNEIAQREGVQAILHGGDFFDIPSPSLAVSGDFVSIMSEAGVPIYGIAGNHDIFGHNPDTLPRTVLGFLDRLGIVKLIHPGQPLLLKHNDVQVQISGQHYHYDLDRRDPRLDYVIDHVEGDIGIHLVHGMLMDKAFIEGVAHTRVDQILDTKAHLTLCGHNHIGWPEVKHDGKIFYNPGGLTRLSNHPADAGRTPQVLILDMTGGELKIKKVKLKSAPPGEEVLDRSKNEEAAFMQQRLAEFVQGIKAAGDYKVIDIGAIIDEIAGREGLPTFVREEAMSRIAAAQERLSKGEGER
ncbi:metallophosphoesterase family protein [Tumebacillus sp. DT12]|uniref:Metallophosphoesterase family protein n=1 Tax=Tumebacillus lacus TaxID=2995335 RepID=A0ABT3X1D1_9BACL|nr:metallophosphoesterase family protein [Tumebacillus lacus]MCX7570729.1 metallophosphoesterase family protein [Tumebacillus lacus]